MPTSSSSSSPIRILLINNDAIASAGVKLLLENRPGLKVVAQAGEKEEALKLAGQEQPDIVLLHECADDHLGLDLFPDLLAMTRKPRIILMTTRNDPQYHMEAVKKGAVGVVVAHNHPEVLYKAIEKVHAGEVWLDRSLIANFVIQRSHRDMPAIIEPKTARIARLSEREREVISLVGEGFKNQQIADQLFLSEVTVRHHLTSIFKKLAVSDRLELVIFAYQNSLAQIPE
jgi:two-component system, NarL family, nitrate/nitrite response regulator NarL